MPECVSFVLVSGLVLCTKLLAVVIHRTGFWFFHDLDLGAGLVVDELITTVIDNNQAAGINDARLKAQIRYRDLVHGLRALISVRKRSRGVPANPWMVRMSATSCSQ